MLDRNSEGPARVLEVTTRQARLLWEAITTVDVGALVDNLNKVGATEDTSIDHEITQLMELLDPDEEFADEWNKLKP